MADSVGAGPSGSSGVLSSAMRSITRMSGEPQERENRQVQDTVDLSPSAISAQAAERPVEPAQPSDQAHNPPPEQAETDLREAEARLEQLRADDDARVQAADAAPSGPVGIGLAAAIAVGLPDMVQRFDVNGDENLDQRERERALRSVQSESSFDQVRGGSARTPDGAPAESGGGEGAEAYAELQARKAESDQRRAEEQAQDELAREDRLAELDEQAASRGQATAAPQRSVEGAYARSEELGTGGRGPRSVDA